MSDRYSRRELLKGSSLTGLGLLLTSCARSLPESTASPQVAPTAAPNKPQAASPAPTNRPAPVSDNVAFVSKDNAAYDALRRGYNKRIDKRPRVIAVCRNTQGVSEAVKYAAANSLPIAIKSGGHSFEGYSCNDDGLVINLSKMRGIEWLDDTRVKVASACTLSELYAQLLPKKRIIPAGSCGSVGIGGLTLGGGYGFFSRKYGLTCDSLTEVTIVDGAGAAHNSRNEPDLLWACRGGGNGSLGVVTELVFQTSPAPATFRSYRFKAANLTAKRAAGILKQWFEAAASLPDSAFSAYVLNGKNLIILVTDFEEPTRQLQNVLDTLRSVTDRATISKPKPPATALKVFAGRPSPLNFRNSSAGLYKSFDDIKTCAESILGIAVDHPGILFQVNTLGGSIANASFESASAFPYRDRPFVAELQSYWTTPERGAALMASCRDIQNLLARNGVSAHYVNYPSAELQNWEQAYYGKNYPRLQQLKRVYDPENRFRYEQSIRPPN